MAEIKNHMNIALTSLVAIVALVAIVVLVSQKASVQTPSYVQYMPTVASPEQAQDLGGQAINPIIIKPTNMLYCNESDKGFDIYKYGVTTLYKNGMLIARSADMCLDATSLREFYCASTQINQADVTCTYGCAKGACNTCYKSDNGDIFQKGTLYHNGIPIVNDSCVTGSVLTEYNCSFPSLNYGLNINCNDYGHSTCNNGRCLLP